MFCIKSCTKKIKHLKPKIWTTTRRPRGFQSPIATINQQISLSHPPKPSVKIHGMQSPLHRI